jgi:hypothetical protein
VSVVRARHISSGEYAILREERGGMKRGGREREREREKGRRKKEWRGKEEGGGGEEGAVLA